MLFKYIIKPLRIVHEVLRAIVPFACQAMCTGEVYLPFHFIHCPVAFAGIEEIDAQSGNNLPTVALLLPVEGERIETVATKIHHGVDLVLYAFAQPALYVLIDSVECIPAAGRVTGCVAVLAYGAGTDFDPGFQRLDPFVKVADNLCDIVPPPLGKIPSVAVFPVSVTVGETGSIFRITQIIEMDTIYVIFSHNLTYKTHQVFFGLGVSGVEEVFTFIGHADCRFAFGDRLFAEGGNVFAVAQGDGDHPGMTFHSPFVALCYGKGKRVVTGIAADFSC